jgi:hypothetical protein
MATRERVYSRPLKGPLTEDKKHRLNDAVARQLGAVLSRQEWHPREPVLTITSHFATLIISFTGDQVVVDAEYGWAARLLLTAENRKKAEALAGAIADEAEL